MYSSLRQCGLIAAGALAYLASAGAAVTDESSRAELMAYSAGSALTLYIVIRVVIRLRWTILQALAVVFVAAVIFAILKSLIGIVGQIG